MISRTVDEWATVAKISKGIKHLFVEGETDARLLAHIYGYPEDVDLRTAREVEDESSSSHPLCGGFKLRLVALSKAASSCEVGNLKCLVDTDFESVFPFIDINGAIFLTKFANLPVSTLHFEWLKSHLLKGYGFTLTDKIWEFVLGTLKFAFAARFISTRNQNPKTAPDLVKFVSVEKGEWIFDKMRYTAQIFGLHQNNAAPHVTKVQQEASLMCGDPREYINSNDAFDLVYALLRLSKLIGGGVSREAIRSAFLAAASDACLYEGAADASTWVKSG